MKFSKKLNFNAFAHLDRNSYPPFIYHLKMWKTKVIIEKIQYTK